MIVACMDSLDWLVTLAGGVIVGVALCGFVFAGKGKTP